MRILLLGEYSNVHNTLAQGLRALGHDVVVASGGDGWKNYKRDIDFQRNSLGKVATLGFFFRLARGFRRFRGFDVVQLINPVFIHLKAERIYPFYNYLRRHNKCIVLGAFGMDYYYATACLNFRTFRYSDFNFGCTERHSADNDVFKRDWVDGPKGKLNKMMAADCDAIVAGLYEYYVSYEHQPVAKGKLHFIPFPIVTRKEMKVPRRNVGDPLRFFIGVQLSRSAYKGTDVMLRALERVKRERPEGCKVMIAESVPFAQYTKMLNESEVILDQLYSYTPAMNALEAMSRGLINVGGAEPENYEILNETELRPIINVQPNEEDVYRQLLYLVDHRDELVPRLQRESMQYIERHHEYRKVAARYAALYESLLVKRKQ